MSNAAASDMIDQYGRRIDYVRMSVTDRCNLRCTYCMPEAMQFMPRRDLLSLDELATIAEHLVARGVRHIRLTGGEPLVRRGVVDLIARIGKLQGRGLREVTLTTNGTQLPAMAHSLFDAGVRRINVSLDTLDPGKFSAITRRDDLKDVLAGIDAAQNAGLAVKLNIVALKGINDCDFPAMVDFCGARGIDMSIIETMPMGQVDHGREDTYLPVCAARDAIARHYTLTPSCYRTSGPSRYFDVAGTGTRIGFISPLSNNFCASCNRIRISATGIVYGCLGHDQSVDLRTAIRAHNSEMGIATAIDNLLARKPLRHEFTIDDAAPSVARTMNVTGG
ncbi:MAG: GTP 3',8-cyclase MoaA [Pontixanthobacter sp.]